MSKIIKKILFLAVLLTLLTKCSGFQTLKDLYTSPNVKLPKIQMQRLANYLNGEFYSTELERDVFAYPIAFIISDDGEKSVILACAGIFNECHEGVKIFQLIKKYEKKLKIKFKILALEKKLINSNSELELEVKNFKNFKRINLKNKENFYDLILIPSENCSGDDC